MLLAADRPSADGRVDVFVALADSGRSGNAFVAVQRLRKAGLRTELEQSSRSMKGQLRHADRIGARVVVIVGAGLEVKDMDSGDQRPAASIEDALGMIEELLA
jgi:histidyl-tRNA synthetase